MSKNVKIYSSRYCGFCIRAKRLLGSKNVAYNEVSVDGDQAARQDLAKRTGQRTVPQIWIGDQHIGGCDDLFALERSGKLDRMLEALA